MNTLQIFKKELRNYFNSSIAYVFFAFFLYIVGRYFYLLFLSYSQASMFATRSMAMMQRLNPVDLILSKIFFLMGFLLIFLMPVITMRLFSEERKLGTIELLFTYPITEIQMVMGKYLAAVVMTAVVFLFTFTYMIIFKNYITPTPWGVIGSSYLGLFLLSLSFLSFGMWVSSVTADQVTAALSTVGGLLILWLVGSGRNLINNETLSEILSQVSLLEHFQNFVKGIIDTNDIVYFICFILLFLFLTVQALEIRKWKG